MYCGFTIVSLLNSDLLLQETRLMRVMRLKHNSKLADQNKELKDTEIHRAEGNCPVADK